MHEEVLGHLDFWTQLRRYLDDHKIQIRLSGSSKSSLSDVFLPRSYFRLRPWHLLKDDQLGVRVEFDGPDAMARYELVAQQHRHQVDERLSRLGALDWQPGKISLSRSTTPSRPETGEERNAWMVNAIETMRALFNEIFPPAPPLKLEFHDGNVVNSDTAEEYDVMAVAARLPWQAQGKKKSSWEDYPPYMPPHEYIVLGKCNYADWDVLYFACTKHPASYRAYFRGLPEPDAVLGGWGWLPLLVYQTPRRLDAEPLHARLRRTTPAKGPGGEADQAKRLGSPALVAAGERLARLPKEAP